MGSRVRKQPPGQKTHRYRTQNEHRRAAARDIFDIHRLFRSSAAHQASARTSRFARPPDRHSVQPKGFAIDRGSALLRASPRRRCPPAGRSAATCSPAAHSATDRAASANSTRRARARSSPDRVSPSLTIESVGLVTSLALRVFAPRFRKAYPRFASPPIVEKRRGEPSGSIDASLPIPPNHCHSFSDNNSEWVGECYAGGPKVEGSMWPMREP